MTDPVPTSHSEPVNLVKVENSATDNSNDTPKVNPQRKPVPEEGKKKIQIFTFTSVK